MKEEGGKEVDSPTSLILLWPLFVWRLRLCTPAMGWQFLVRKWT